jgi:NAD-dependent deacetylase
MNTSVRELEDLLRQTGSIAVLTGAGISTASGIPDFRSAAGIYSDERNVNVFDLPAFRRDPSFFYGLPAVLSAGSRRPTQRGHRALAEWQRQDWI